jgi:hypothetical protein
MLARGPTPLLWNAGISFPLERLYRLTSTGIWSDPASEDLWNKMYPLSPYQLWDRDPTTTTEAVLTLEDITMACDWCQNVVTLDLDKFHMMYAGTGMCRCPSCSQEFETKSLSEQHLKSDLLKFQSSKEKWYSLGYTV